MPFFSFVLNKDYNSSQLDSNINERIILQKYTRYYCKNTTIWRNLKSKKYNYLVDNISYEKRKKINHQNKNIIFCLPPSIGIGDAIEYGFSIKAIQELNKYNKIGIAFSSKSSSLLEKNFGYKHIYSDFISELNLNQYDSMFHFTLEIEKLKLQKYKRSNIEKEILNFFEAKPFRFKKSNYAEKIKTISIFPISKSPIRTLPAKLVNNIIEYLIDKEFDIHLVLDNSSEISKTFEKEINNQFIKILSPNNLIDLDKYIKNIDYGIFCDSGPLHISKLYNKKGIVISTSVNSNNLINDLDNILLYNSIYNSKYCNAPCGLTDILNYDSQHGCYDTLQKKEKEILNSSNINLLNRGNLNESYKFFIQNPVGCVRSIDLEKIKELLKKTLI